MIELLKYSRAGIPEVIIYGAVSWAHGRETIYSDQGEQKLFGRSLMKPFQMKVFADDLGAVLNLEAQAISVASHNAEPRHLTAAHEVLGTIDESLMQTPVSLPAFGGGSAVSPSLWNHPCSGKHAAILQGSSRRGWPLESYLSEDHPYHKAYLQVLRATLGSDWQPDVTAVDGCGLSTVSMSLNEMARLYASLVSSRDDDFIWQAMVSRPEWVGGAGRLDTQILALNAGSVLAKEGADGLLGLAIRHADFPDGLGVVVKIAHGYDARAMTFLARAVLSSLGLQAPAGAEPDRQTASISENLVPPSLRVGTEPRAL